MLVIHETSTGLKEVREVPNGAFPRDYHKGVLVGPPDLTPLGLPFSKMVALNNRLVEEGIIEFEDLRGNKHIVRSILRALDIEDGVKRGITSLYQRREYPEAFGEL